MRLFKLFGFGYWKREALIWQNRCEAWRELHDIEKQLIREVCVAVGYNYETGRNGWTGEEKPLVKHIEDHLDELGTEINEAQSYLHTSWMRDVSGLGTVRERMERVIAFVDLKIGKEIMESMGSDK